MKLIDQFGNFLDEKGVDRSAVQIEKTTDYDLASFGEMSQEGIPYNVMFIFYPDNDAVEIHIRKQIDITDKLNVLSKINVLTAYFFGICFFLQEDLLVLKMPIFVSGNINEVLKGLQNTMKIANSEFPKFIQP